MSAGVITLARNLGTLALSLELH